jgi:antitoxin PrlF
MAENINKIEITKISSKGQIVIPLRIRNQLKINEGSVMAIDTTNEMIILKKIDVDLIKQFRNSLADLKAGKIKRVA